MRRTFTSLLFAIGEDPVYVMGQLGHRNPNFTLRVYAQEMARRDGERDRLKALVEGGDWARMGTNRDFGAPTNRRRRSRETKNPLGERGSGEAADGTRTHDLLHGKQTVGTAKTAGNAWKCPGIDGSTGESGSGQKGADRGEYGTSASPRFQSPAVRLAASLEGRHPSPKGVIATVGSRPERERGQPVRLFQNFGPKPLVRIEDLDP
jgi:hypothetical protein